MKNNFRALLEKHYGVKKGARLPTQETIAADSKINQPTISTWLSGEIKRYDRATIEAMCDFLGCGVGELLEYVPGERPPERETA